MGVKIGRDEKVGEPLVVVSCWFAACKRKRLGAHGVDWELEYGY
jgi:hypothetical protein